MKPRTSRTVCVTGASSGIGLDTARVFAEKGDRLIIGARRTDRLEHVASELRELGAAAVFHHELDVQSEASVAAFCEAAGKFCDHRIDVLVNNAGLALGRESIVDGDFDQWETMMNTNVMGLLRVTRRIAKGMIERKSGHIVMLGSIAGHQVYEGGGVYCASKHAVMAITRTLKLELCGTGVRVSSIDPGMVNTEFSLVRLGDQAKADEVYKGVTPLSGRDVAECIEFVVSRPPHVNIDDLIIMPTAQATVYKVHRNG